jgi:hypothetical protein
MKNWPLMLDHDDFVVVTSQGACSRLPDQLWPLVLDRAMRAQDKAEGRARRILRSLNSYELKIKMLGAT